MWFFYILGVTLILSVNGDDLDLCKKPITMVCPKLLLLMEYDIDENGLPNDEYLDENCPSMLEVVHCVKAYVIQCARREIQEEIDLIDLNNKIIEIVTQLCDKTSDLRQGYSANVGCFNDHINNMEECKKKFTPQLVGFSVFLEEDKGYDYRSTFRKLKCLNIALDNDCVSRSLSYNCGQEALDTFGKFLPLFPEILGTTCPKEELMALLVDFVEFTGKEGFEGLDI